MCGGGLRQTHVGAQGLSSLITSLCDKFNTPCWELDLIMEK